MTNSKNIVIRTADTDNVGIAASVGGLKKDTIALEGIVARENIPMGHKVALRNIRKGDSIVRYGQIIGTANQDIFAGEWVEGSKMVLPEPPDLENITMPTEDLEDPKPLEGYSFMGYRNSDGSVGTKNILGITTSVQCVAGFTQFVADKIRKELLPDFPHVDDVVALNHNYGCGIAINAPGTEIPVRTLQNISTNPNFGEEVLIIGLGCEKLQPESLLMQNGRLANEGENGGSEHILRMQDESLTGAEAIIQEAMRRAKLKLSRLNQRKRVVCPASDLVVGMQCGGSDAFSGITANPAVGFATDLIVRAGGTVLFSEVTEVRDAIQLMVPRTASVETAEALIREMRWYDNYLARGEVNRSANPTPGNKRGGLSNIVEKALGSVVKSGTVPINDVLSPGEKIRTKGLVFAATPASDFICGTLQLAAGMNMHVFTTGRGTPYGLSMVPVIKVGSNTSMSSRWHDLIDLDAGRIATGEKTIEETGWELFHLILDVASGKKQVACDRLGFHNELALFNPAPVT